MKVTIDVRAEHIAYGQPCLSMDCPVWHAAVDALASLGFQPEDIAIGPDSMWFRSNEAGNYVWLPRIVALKIDLFDDTGRMEPFSFALDVPDHLVPAPVPELVTA